MNILVVGAGVIGTVYGAHLGAANHRISVLAHGERTAAIAVRGLHARDITSGIETQTPAAVVTSAAELDVDVVLVALRRDHLHGAAAALAGVTPDALVLFMGNNPAGRSGLPSASGAQVALGFPGVGGTMRDDVVTYFTIAQQPTAIEASDSPRLAAVADALTSRGLPVQRVSDMDGWLAYHAVFVAAMSAGLYRCGTDPTRLADDRATLKLTCAAITEGFRALHADRVRGLPTQPRRAAQPLADSHRHPLLGAGHAIAHGGVGFRRPRPTCRARDAPPRARRHRAPAPHRRGRCDPHPARVALVAPVWMRPCLSAVWWTSTRFAARSMSARCANSSPGRTPVKNGVQHARHRGATRDENRADRPAVRARSITRRQPAANPAARRRRA